MATPSIEEVTKNIEETIEKLKTLVENRDSSGAMFEKFVDENDFHFILKKEGEESFTETNMNGVVFGQFLMTFLRETKGKDKDGFLMYTEGIEAALKVLEDN